MENSKRIIKFRAWDKDLNRMLNMDDVTVSTLNATHNPVMQFTGLLDKNGKEIYEGDIVQISILTGDKARMEIKIPDIFIMLSKHSFGMEIIGNIYENPNLLK